MQNGEEGDSSDSLPSPRQTQENVGRRQAIEKDRLGRLGKSSKSPSIGCASRQRQDLHRQPCGHPPRMPPRNTDKPSFQHNSLLCGHSLHSPSRQSGVLRQAPGHGHLLDGQIVNAKKMSPRPTKLQHGEEGGGAWGKRLGLTDEVLGLGVSLDHLQLPLKGSFVNVWAKFFPKHISCFSIQKTLP